MSDNQDQLVISYRSLMKMVGLIAVSLPILLFIASVLIADCEKIHMSVSDYYHTPMRNLLVGALCAIAMFMYTYKGFERTDNIAGNLASIFALGVAFFPTSVTCELACNVGVPSENPIISKIHFVSAGLLFAVLIYFCLFLFTKTNPNKKMSIQKIRRNIVYKVCGYIMIACILFIAAYFFYLSKNNTPCGEAPMSYNVVFWMETVALWAFGISWLTKGEFIFKDK